MATRTVNTKIAIDGEAAYKESLKNINSALGTLKSELKLVETQYEGQANSYAALSAKGSVLSKMYDEQKEKLQLATDMLKKAEDAQDEYSKRVSEAKSDIERTESALAALGNETGDTSEEQAKLTAELEKAKQQLSEAEKGYDSAGRSVNSYQTQANNAEAEVTKLGSEIEKNNKYLDEAEKSSDGCASSIDEYGKEVKQAGNESEDAGKKFSAVKTTVAALGTAAAASVAAIAAVAAKAASALVSMTVSGAAYADDVLTVSTQTGIATDALQGYMYAADLVDVSTDTLTKSMAKQIKSMGSYADGSKSVVAAYDKLGVKVLDASGNMRDSDTVYWETIDALGKMSNETERDELAMSLLGKSAQELNPIIEQGSGRMKELAAEAAKAGYILSDDTLNAYGALQDNLDRLSVGATAAKNALGTALLPILSQLSGDGVELINNFTQAINGADGDLGKMAEAIGDSLNEAVDKIAEYAPEIINTAVEIINGLASGILDNIPQIVEVVAGILPKIAEAIADAVPSLAGAAVSIVTTLVEGIISALPALVDAAAQILTGLVTGIAEALPTLIPAAVSAVTQIVQALIDNIPLLIDAALQLVTGLAQGVIDAIPVLLEALPKLISSLVDTLLTAIPEIIETGISLLTALVTALPQIITTICAVLPQIIDSTIKTLLDHLPELVQAGVDLLVALIQNLPLIISTISKAMPQIVKSIVNAFTSNIPQIVQTGITLLTALVTDLPQIIVTIGRALGELISGMVQTLGNGVSSFVSIGANLLRGLWDGIISVKDWILGKVRDLGNSIIQGFKDTFGIHSPSRVAAEIGTNFGGTLGKNIAGAIENSQTGIDKATSAMISEVEGKMSEVNSAISDSLGDIETGFSAKATIEHIAAAMPTVTPGNSSPGSPGSGSDGGKSVTNHFSIAELVVREEADVKKIAKSLYDMQKSASRGRGVVTA